MAEAATGIPYDPTPTEETTSITKVGGTRLDKFLAKIAGEDVDITPKTETERRLNEIAQNGSGCGSEPFVVTFSGTTEDGDAACDKTFAEIAEAYAASKTIIAQYAGRSGLIQTAVEYYSLNTRTRVLDGGLIGFMGGYIAGDVDTGEITKIINCAITRVDIVSVGIYNA